MPLESSLTMLSLSDLHDDPPMSLPAAAAYIGKLTGSKPHASTIWRWCLRGCKGIRLDSICIGGKRFVTAAALERFVTRTSEPQDQASVTEVVIRPQSSPQIVRHNPRRREEIEAARRRLDELTGVHKPRRAPPPENF